MGRPILVGENARLDSWRLRSAPALDPLLELERGVGQANGAVSSGQDQRDQAIIDSLSAAVRAKDMVTSLHLRGATEMGLRLARLMAPRLADSREFLFGCLLHDIGKIGVPDRILNKPGPLDELEWEVMRRHPRTGEQVLRPLGLAPLVGQIVLHHHERWDGGGYPAGLQGEDIPLPVRLFSVGDALEAMTAPRPYRAALSAIEAFRRVLAESGRQFDPSVVDALERGVSAGEIALEGPARAASLAVAAGA